MVIESQFSHFAYISPFIYLAFHFPFIIPLQFSPPPPPPPKKIKVLVIIPWTAYKPLLRIRIVFLCVFFADLDIGKNLNADPAPGLRKMARTEHCAK